MTEDELELFIAEQKARIAQERKQLELNKSLDKSQEFRNGLMNGSKENIPPSNSKDEGKALPRGSYANLREKLNAERKEEYNRFLAEKNMRSGKREHVIKSIETTKAKDNNSLGIGERNSAKIQARRVRNQEYNDFLKQKDIRNRTGGESVSDEQKILNMNGFEKHSPRGSNYPKEHTQKANKISSEEKSRSPQPRQEDHYDPPRSPRRRYDDRYRPPRSPRRSHDDRYDHPRSHRREYYDTSPRYERRQYDEDLPPPPRRGWGTPVHLDYEDILRRKREEEARYRRYDDDLDYYRGRSIRPSASDPYLNRPGSGRRRYDHYDDDDDEDDRDYDSRRVRFDEERRDKGRHRRDMYEDKDQNDFREERSRTMPEMERVKQKSEPPVNTKKQRPKSAEDEGFFIGQRQSQSAVQRKKQEYRKELEKQMEEAREIKRRNRNMEKEEGLKVNATGLQDPEKLPDRLGGLSNHANRQTYSVPSESKKYQSSFPTQGQNLPLDTKAPMLDKPFDLRPYNYKSESVDPYLYYGARNPMEGEPGSALNPYYYGYRDGYPGSSSYGRGHDPSQNNSSYLDSKLTQATQKTGQPSIEDLIGNDSTNSKKNDYRSYQDELLQQIQEKERRKREEKAAQERYDLKMEEEAKIYQPFGKGGGGAPMRDNKGHIIADLKQVKHMQTVEDMLGSSSLNNQVGLPQFSPRDQLQTNQNLQGVSNTSDTSPKTTQDEYKESLRQQIEEKKRRQAEEKERERLSEEKQERDLKEQREKIQREFEEEKEKQRLKEEKTRQQNEELARKAEEKRKEAQLQKAAFQENMSKPATRVAEVQREAAELAPRVESPPIPTLRKEQPRNDSPPIPTLQKKEEQEHTQSKVPSPRNNSPVVPSLRQMQGYKQDDGRTSPPVPAVSTKERAGESDRDVMSALSVMRKQLQSEQRRVQQALEREYDPYSHVPSSHTSRRPSPQVNVLDLEKKKPKPITVRRDLTNHAAAQDFNNLKDRGSQSRQKVREQYPNQPTSDLALEAQQRALLRQQQEKLDAMRKAYRPTAYDMPPLNLHNIGRRVESPMIALESSSAFIGVDSGESKIPADERSLPGSARTKDLYGDIGSINDDALDIMERKNKERIAALAAIESDGMSNEDPDDVIQRFMSKTSNNRPPTGKSEDLSLWLQPTDI